MCGYICSHTPEGRGVLGSTWPSHLGGRGWHRIKVRTCFPFPPKGIRRNKFRFKKIFLLMKVKKYLNTYLKDTEKLLSLEDRTDQG